MFRLKTIAILYCITRCVGTKVDNYLGPEGQGDEPNENQAEYENVELDIASKSPQPGVELSNLKPYDIDVRLYKLDEGLRLSKVVEGRNELWLNKTNFECRKVSLAYDEGKPMFMCVNCEDENGQGYSYYMMNGPDSWTAVRNQFFYSIFNDFVLEKTARRKVDLNISGTLDENDFYFNSSDGFPFIVIVPNVSVTVNSVYDRNDLIWTSPSKSTRFQYLSIYHDRDNPLMCLITNSAVDSKVYYMQTKGKWELIRREDYLTGLKNSGVDLMNFDNTVGLDLSKCDTNKFYQRSFVADMLYLQNYYAKPGLKLTRIKDGTRHLWKAENDEEYCSYAGVSIIEGKPTVMILYIKGAKKRHRVEYFCLEEDKWEPVDEVDYYHVLRTGRLPTEEDVQKKQDPECVTNYFRNKQGLHIKTYLFRAQKPKGAIILVHGHREYFMSNFLNYNQQWNFENYGFPSFPNLNSVEDFELGDNNSYSGNPNKYEDMFEYTAEFQEIGEEEGRFKYEGSMVEVFNEMGLDVYGLDLQSYGFSESTGTRSCVDDFQDHVNDLLQFVDIVKRDRFSDQDNEWTEDVYSEGTHIYRDNLFMLGYSMGANVVFQAIQQFNTHAKAGVDFVNGAISLSGMLKLDHRFSNTLTKTVSVMVLGFMNLVAPRTESSFEGNPDFTVKMDYYLKLLDGFYYSKGSPNKSLYQFFKATDKVKAQMNRYPKRLPTMFIHCRQDMTCSIEGPREIYERYMKEEPNNEFVEVRGNLHDTPSPLFIYNYLPQLKNWLERMSSDEQRKAREIARIEAEKEAAKEEKSGMKKKFNDLWNSPKHRNAIIIIAAGLFVFAVVLMSVIVTVRARKGTKLRDAAYYNFPEVSN